MTRRAKPLPKLRADGQPKRSGRPPKDPTKNAVSRLERQEVIQRPSKNKFMDMSGDDLDDLLGLPLPPAPGKTVSGASESPLEDAQFDPTNIIGGVSIQWLCEAFRLGLPAVRRKLANCPIVGMHNGKHARYDVGVAASYLIKPRFDIGEYIKTMKPHDLPPILQAAYWDAQKKRQDWEVNAGELWPTDKVVGVLAETFKLIKTSVTLFTDSLEQEHGLTESQRTTLTSMCDGLMDDIHNSLVRQHDTSHTPNQKATLIEMEAHSAAAHSDLIGDDDE